MYLLYGLRVQADNPIPGLVSAGWDGAADVELVLGSLPNWVDETEASKSSPLYVSPFLDEHGRPNLLVSSLRHGSFYLLRYSDATEFLVNAAGTIVWSRWPLHASFENACIYLLGPVLGFVLQLRGFTSLHASSVVLGGQAVAFVGDCGAGKSTTAAAFAARGYGVLSDDVLALREANGDFIVQHGYPRLRLWPSAVRQLFGSEEALPKLAPEFDKRFLDISQGGYRFEVESAPLAAIYIFRDRVPDDDAPRIGHIELGEGLIHLVGNTYAYYLHDSARRARDFAFLGRLASRVALRTLTPHEDPGRLPQLCDAVMEDLALLQTTTPR